MRVFRRRRFRIRASPPTLILSAQKTTPDNEYELDAWRVELNFEALNSQYRAPYTPIDRLTIELPGLAKSVAIADLDRNLAASWYGRVGAQHDVLISWTGERLRARMFTDRELFVIYPDRDGHILAKINPLAGYPDEPIVPDSQPKGIAHSAPARVESMSNSLSTTSVIDVLIVFTQQAAADVAVGAPDFDQALIQFAQLEVDQLNAAFYNSQATNAYFRLAGAQAIARSDTGDTTTDLLWLRSDSGVISLRDAFYADVVVMIANYGPPFSGRAFIQNVPGPAFAPNAFGVVDRLSAQNGTTFQHEVGHIMGMDHHRNNSTTNPPSFPWSYGHAALPDPPYTEGFTTIMSYAGTCGGSPPCYPIPYYSNGSLTLPGSPVWGRAIGIPDVSENYRTGAATAPIVSQFRIKPPPMFESGFED